MFCGKKLKRTAQNSRRCCDCEFPLQLRLRYAFRIEGGRNVLTVEIRVQTGFLSQKSHIDRSEGSVVYSAAFQNQRLGRVR
jgi:hypothetical protein